MTSGSVQNQDAYMQAVAGQRPYFFEHISEITEQVMDEYASLTGRQYSRVGEYKMEDAEYVILGQGSMITQAQAVADYLRETRKLKVGVANLTIYRPFPGDMIGKVLKGRKGVVVLERTDQPLAEDLPLIREIRAAISKCIENGAVEGEKPYPTYANYKGKDIPALYSGSYGLGSRDLQPEGLIGAIENMLDDGKKKKFFYLGVDFVREAANPTAEIRQQELLDSYPHIAEMAVRGSENPDLLPEGAITMRMHSVGGWGAITTGKNLAMTLYDLLGYDIRANPKYGSEKKGQPTTYYLSAAPERIRLNCEYHFVDVVLSPDPNVFGHSNPLYGLKDGGFFIIQSNLGDADAVWQQIPVFYQKYINEHNIRVYFVDGFKIAKEEASNPDLQFRMQGNAFQGAFFAASPLMERANLTEEELFKSIEAQLQSKFGGKGANVVADNLRVVRRGFDEIVEITNKEISSGATQIKKETKLPIMLKQMPKGDEMRSDIHHFWEQTGSFYLSGQGNENLVDPLIATSLIPAATGVYRDMTQIRFEYPKFITENCTACGDCYTTCPDSAIPGLVNSVSDVFATAIERIETKGTLTSHLRRETRTVEKKLRALIETQGEQAVVSQLLDQAVLETLSESEFEGTKKEKLEKEFALFLDSIGGFEFSITKPYYSNKEKKQKGTGGLFSITINPYTCKGCMECVQVCDDGALVAETQTQDSIDTLRKDWAFWLDLPTTKEEYIRIDDLEEKIGALETLLLDKKNYNSLISGDGACLGCGEKTAIHIFTGTVTALMQPRVKKHISELDDLINRMETHIRLKLASSMDLSDTSAINSVVAENEDNDLTLSALSEQLSDPTVDEPVDQKWLKWATQLLEKLRHLKWLYTDGKNHVGRAEMGIVNATGCTSVWGSTFPFSPYPFPWTSHLFQDSPSVAMGLFEGHMSKMAEGFKAVRMAKLELEGKYDEVEHGSFFTYFDWKKFSDEEWQLCPPVTAVGGDGAMYDIGFQNLSRALASGMPIKVLILDTQVYSNTGGQSCTSGFIGQVADMAPYGKVMKGKTEIRKEMGIIGMAHRTSYILQSSQANVTHMIEGFIDGLNSRRPAMFNLYTTCQPEHGVADDATDMQTKMALESRAYPMFKYDPDEGTTFKECCDIEGNPSIDQDWVTYDLTYTDENGKEAKMTLPFTFADWALTEGRFRKQFSKAPQAAWNDDMVPLHEFLDMEEDDREGLFPYIWAVDNKNQLMRVLVAQEIVLSCEERRDFWHQLRSLAGEDPADQVDAAAIANQAKAEMAQSVASSLLSLAGGDPSALGDMAAAPAGGNGAATSTATAADFEPVWIETPECTACDECVEIAPQTFQYNDDKLAVVINPSANSYKEIVKAAEKCTAECIHPGTPWNMSEKDIEKLTKRAEKYQ
jgi:pyruvate-ferredoxin/flavodoxin oxidoreductase